MTTTQNHGSDCSGFLPGGIPNPPEMPTWTEAEGVAMYEDIPGPNTAVVLMNLWTEWADEIESALRQVASLLLHVDHEDLVDFIFRLGASLPTRPQMPDRSTDQGKLEFTLVEITRMRLYAEWVSWGDKVWYLYIDMADKVARSNPRLQRWEIAEDEGFGISRLSISAIRSSPENLVGLICRMLGEDKNDPKGSIADTNDLVAAVGRMAINPST